MSKKADFLENCLLADFGQKPSFSNKVTFSREHALFLQKLGFGTNGSIFDQKQHFRRICEETSKKSKNALNCAKVYRKTVHILISKLAQLGDPDRRHTPDKVRVVCTGLQCQLSSAIPFPLSGTRA